MPNNQIKSLTIGGVTYDIVDETSNWQAQLVSGTNIKTINNQSLLGSGNISISGGGGTGTITEVKTTAGAHTTIDVTSGSASFNVPTNTSHLTNDSGFVTTDTKNTVGSSSNTNTLCLVGTLTTGSASTSQSYINSQFRIQTSSNISQLDIGNTTSSSSTSSQGMIRIYEGYNKGLTVLKPSVTTGTKTITFPSTTGTLALTSDITVSDVTLDGTSVVSSGIAALTSTAVSTTDDGNGNVTLVVSGVSAASGGSF